MAVIGTFDADKKKKSTRIAAAVLDDSANVIWNNDLELEGNQKQNEVLSYRLDDKNNLIALAKIYENGKGKERKKGRNNKEIATYQVTLMQLPSQGTKVTNYPIDLDGAFVDDIALVQDNLGEIRVCGFYRNKYKGYLNGILYVSFDSSYVVNVLSKKPFSFSDLKLMNASGVQVNLDDRDKMGISNDFHIKDWIERSDGSYLLISELSESYDQTFYRDNFNNGFNSGYNNFGTASRTNTYITANEVVLVPIFSDGEIGQLNVISKKQKALVDTDSWNGGGNVSINRERVERHAGQFISYATYVNGEELLIIYNDDERNLDKNSSDKRRVLTDQKRMDAAVTALSRDMITETFPLFEEDSDFTLMPSFSHQISSSTFFTSFLSLNSKYLKMGTLTFK